MISPFTSSQDPSVTPLAHITYGDSIIRVMWRRKTREAIIDMNGTSHVVQRDTSIIDSLASLIDCKSHEIAFTNLVIYEFPYQGQKATRELRRGLYSCNWSDYGNDNMGFGCDIVLRDHLPESYYQGHAVM
jgi:hypothetical protein